MTGADWMEVSGLWLGLWVSGYLAGSIQRWYQGISEKL